MTLLYITLHYCTLHYSTLHFIHRFSIIVTPTKQSHQFSPGLNGTAKHCDVSERWCRVAMASLSLGPEEVSKGNKIRQAHQAQAQLLLHEVDWGGFSYRTWWISKSSRMLSPTSWSWTRISCHKTRTVHMLTHVDPVQQTVDIFWCIIESLHLFFNHYHCRQNVCLCLNRPTVHEKLGISWDWDPWDGSKLHPCLGFIKHDVTLKGLMVVQAWKRLGMSSLAVCSDSVSCRHLDAHNPLFHFLRIQFRSFPFGYNLRDWLSHKHCFGPSGFCRYRRRALAWRLSSRES